MRYIPLFTYLLILYNALAFMGGPEQSVLAAVWLKLNLISGAVFTITVDYLLIIVGVIILYIEIYKSTRPSAASVIDHALSMVVFVIYLIEFIIVPNVGTAAFLVLTLMAFLDVIAGFTVSISSARRDISIG
ncbi:hypothetical protein [Desulfonema ishimotonii]|uniref:hypothetical protein n=1 Tax=Desulfonema ishimotonii TaxID=45657 RepID=UPI000F55B8DC|nr:hypothetical protein [Desulfonema ishimotonii]